jgi:Fe-Mn family superoxide dismutase
MNADRRTFIKTSAILTAGTALTMNSHVSLAASLVPTGSQDAYSLPDLGYAFNALEPHFDAETMRLHHDKHHQAYVNKLNEAVVAEPEIRSKDLESLLKDINALPSSVRTSVRNNGGGHWNHTFFWRQLRTGTKPGKDALKRINKQFGSLDKMKAEFTRAASSVFGSGWAWLVEDKDGLSIGNTPNQDNPLMDVVALKGKPLFALDVWEHAYYLKYQNKRADYINAFWNVLDWDTVEARLKG